MQCLCGAVAVVVVVERDRQWKASQPVESLVIKPLEGGCESSIYRRSLALKVRCLAFDECWKDDLSRCKSCAEYQQESDLWSGSGKQATFVPVFVPVANRIGVVKIRVMQPGVHDHEALEAFRHHRGLGKSGGTAPVLTYQGDPFEIECCDQGGEDLSVPGDGVPVDVSRFVGSTKAHVIRCDAAVAGVNQ